ncbi:MAG: ABC transporter permease subunit [Chloroflexota bacterium]
MTMVPAAASRAAGSVTRRLDRLGDRTFALLISVPALLLVALFVLPPILAVFGLSLFRIELAKDDYYRTPFVGLFNYVTRLPIDSVVLDTIPRTLGFAAAVTAVTIPLALLTALILNRAFRGSGLFLMAVMTPWAVASVVTGVIWRFIFDTHSGIINGILIGLGLIHEPINWLQDSGNAVLIAVVATAWRSIPLVALLILAALRTIPGSLYRAARMDGATSWETFRFVILPAIRPTLLVVAVLQVIVGLQVFDLLFSLTGGGPGRQTYVLIYAIYDKAFNNLSLGYAAALSVVLFGIIVVCSLLLVLAQGRRRSAEPQPTEDDAEALEPTLTFSSSDDEAALATIGQHRYEGSRRRRRVRWPAWVGRLAFGVTAAALLLFFTAPIIWSVICSIQPYAALAVQPPALTLTNPWLDGYATIFGDPKWFGSLLVSLQVAILTTLVVIVLAAPAAYARLASTSQASGASSPSSSSPRWCPPWSWPSRSSVIFRWLRITDTVLALVLVNVAFGCALGGVAAAQLFRGRLGVAGARRAHRRLLAARHLFRVVVPAASPGIAATAILLLIGTWNEFLFAVILGQRDTITITRRIVSTNSYGFSETLNQLPPANMLASAGLVAVFPACCSCCCSTGASSPA